MSRMTSSISMLFFRSINDNNEAINVIISYASIKRRRGYRCVIIEEITLIDKVDFKLYILHKQGNVMVM